MCAVASKCVQLSGNKLFICSLVRTVITKTVGSRGTGSTAEVDIVVTVIFHGDQQRTLMHILPLASLLHNTQLILHKLVILLIAFIRLFLIYPPSSITMWLTGTWYWC